MFKNQNNTLVVLGGVLGLACPILVPVSTAFISLAGLSNWKEHIKVSSTLIIAPELSYSPQ